jgi:hypothetical protein
MKIVVVNGIALSVLRDDLSYPFIGKLKPDMICEDLSLFHQDPNTRQILLVREWGHTYFMTIEDIKEELSLFDDEQIMWISKKRRKEMFDYFTKIYFIMKQYKREERINKVLNSNESLLHLAC